MLPLLPHFYVCDSLCPEYHPRSPQFPASPSSLNSTTFHMSAFLVLCPLPPDSVIPTHTPREPHSSFMTCHLLCGQSSSLSVLEKGPPAQERPRLSKVHRSTSMFLYRIKFQSQGSPMDLLPQHHIRHGLSLSCRYHKENGVELKASCLILSYYTSYTSQGQGIMPRFSLSPILSILFPQIHGPHCFSNTMLSIFIFLSYNPLSVTPWALVSPYVQ